MLFFDSPFTSPYDNLALEEHLFTTLPEGESALLLWQNDNTIVVGKNQNAAAEIDIAYVKATGIRVARRLSGGGAVYHDMGNLNFTIITTQRQFEAFHFQSFVTPVLETLASFGLHAEFTGRNDLTLNGKKFCGNAQYAKGNKLLHHGCIMLSTDLGKVGKALTANKKKFDTKAVKSIASRVTTINAQAATPIEMADFKAKLQAFVFANADMTPYDFTAQDRAAVLQKSREKYATNAWIYKALGAYHSTNEARFAWGLAQVAFDAKDGKIAQIDFAGDFFGKQSVDTLCAALVGAPLDGSLRGVLAQLNIADYMQGATPEEISDFILAATAGE